MELLDNLPHDKVVRAHAQAPWQQVHVARSAAPYVGSATGRDDAAYTASDDVGRFLLTTAARGTAGPCLREQARPLSDALIKRCYAAAHWLPGGAAAPPSGASDAVKQRGVWQRALDALAGVSHGDAAAASPDANVCYLPTGALQLFDALHAQRPRHHLIVADFERFAPGDVKLPGVNAPIVSTTVRCTM